MSNSEKFSTCRLVDDEIEYISRFWDGKFSDYVHSSIKDDIQQLRENNKQQRLQIYKDFSLYIVLIGLGAVFYLFGVRSISLVEMVSAFVLGTFMFTVGIVGGVLVALQSTRRNKIS